MKLRANASLQALATATKERAEKLNDEHHSAMVHADSCFPNNWHEKCRASDIWEHYRDVRDLAEHLNRLANS